MYKLRYEDTDVDIAFASLISAGGEKWKKKKLHINCKSVVVEGKKTCSRTMGKVYFHVHTAA